MIHAFSPEFAAPVLAIVTHPVALLWMSGWVAAALGCWLRVALPPSDNDDGDVAIVIAGCVM